MKNGIMRILTLLLLTLSFSACNQDPIFYTVSREVAPREPSIPGKPTNFVTLKYTTPGTSSDAWLLFTASGKKLHWYREESGWDNSQYQIPQPGGWIKYLASAKDQLFAICYPDSAVLQTPSLKWLNQSSGDWVSLDFSSGDDAGAYPFFQAIYADGDYLFIAAEQRDSTTGKGSFAILYADVSSPSAPYKIINKLNAISEELRGVVKNGSNYYLCTKAGKVYEVSMPAGTSQALSGTADSEFMGMIGIPDNNTPPGIATIAAIARNGKLYNVKTSASEIEEVHSMGNYATSALAVWTDPTPSGSGEKVLLVGKQDTHTYTTSSGYTYGYREFRSTGGGGFDAPHEPGIGTYTSVGDNERYTSTIGKRHINFIIQTPTDVDANRPLFASTQKNGVWSYRHNGKDPQWNAE